MGFFSDILGAAAPIAGAFFGGPVGASIGGALGGMLSSKSAPTSATTTQQQQLDPRIQSMLFGGNGDPGLLDQYKNMLTQPAGAQAYQGAGNDYLSQYSAQDLGAVRGAATGLMSGQSAPTMSGAQMGSANAALPAYSVGNKVQAPSQNGMDLSGSYDRLVNSTPGANPYLDQSINGAIAQNRLGFQQLQSDATDNLQRNILPGIRSASVLSGQYGGSRQGVAEGNAIGDFSKSMASAANQFGQNATNAAVGAKAGAYDADSNRALAATQGLGAQQYGVASQNANTANQAEFQNVANSFDASKNNANLAQQAWMANQNSTNAANAANLQAQLTTNGQNNAGALGGAGLLGGLGTTAMGAANSDLSRAQGVNGLLAPYMTANAGSTSTQPLYQNTAGNMLGGATAALGLYNQFNGSTGYNGIRNNDNYGVNVGSTSVFNTPSSVSNYTPTAYAPPNISGLLNL